MANSASKDDVDRLLKLLGMTTSSNDGEALTAMRMANKEATAKFGGWEKLLRGKVMVIGDPFLKAQPTPTSVNRTAKTPQQMAEEARLQRERDEQARQKREAEYARQRAAAAQYAPKPVKPRSHWDVQDDINMRTGEAIRRAQRTPAQPKRGTIKLDDLA